MRKKVVLGLSVLILVSCGKLEQKKPPIEFIITENGFHKNYEYRYEVEGEMINKTQNIYEKVVVSTEVEFLLENGNILTEKDLDMGLSFFSPREDFLSFVKPNEKQEVKGVRSMDIPVEYLEYPIKKVKAKHIFKLEDKINGTKEIFVDERDITDVWNNLRR
jgi:lipoprotein